VSFAAIIFLLIAIPALIALLPSVGNWWMRTLAFLAGITIAIIPLLAQLAVIGGFILALIFIKTILF
jgi:hypothetical protein